MLDKNEVWEDYVELVVALTPYIDREFYAYTKTAGLEGYPRSGWPAEKIKGTELRRYYTGETFCFLRDKNGNVFIGTAVCSDKESSFRKRTGKHVSKQRALLAMRQAYKVCGSPDNVSVIRARDGGLREMTIVLDTENSITGLALLGEKFSKLNTINFEVGGA